MKSSSWRTDSSFIYIIESPLELIPLSNIFALYFIKNEIISIQCINDIINHLNSNTIKILIYSNYLDLFSYPKQRVSISSLITPFT